ncbi:LnmK family bifunctional acyltransferase/decarboxylase [Streptomyces sp. NBC_01669]|uniref:LnmK family bifunctional acyltransferase/decarboxylase n=1 Tax=Streptomyces sp. NBC_01669 TaxID=2975909 RepID=UPI002252775E|nr:LnmK family bifunctional acyltransferase/decarboxylase [Streptomyces sp. NBC_01669]MCX4530637.1 biosynthesis cluster domain-containing protein [Streptomyces sp. NBC_01669]
MKDETGTPGLPGWASPRILDRSTVSRDVTVAPGMCGTGLFVGQLGDWTWEAVSALCGVDVFAARNRQGEPAYLSFYYFRIRAGRRFHVGALNFGDRLRVTSGLFNYGSESVLALHTVRRQDSDTPVDEGPFDPEAFYAGKDEDCLYVENFNRWISRGRTGSNEDLVRSSPPDFHYAELPRLPAPHSPRADYRNARTNRTFLDGEPPGRLPTGPTRLTYAVDATRDINGVGLLYFASYFSITDWALLRHWRGLGRDVHDFMGRTVLDQRMCYLGNADPEAELAVEVTGWVRPGAPHDEIVTVVLENTGTGQVIAVSTLHVTAEGTQ